MTAGDLSDFLTDVAENYSGTVYDVIAAHSSTLGEVGWSNAAASGTETGDCTACVVPEVSLYIEVESGQPYAQNLVRIEANVWECESIHFDDGTEWLLVDSVDCAPFNVQDSDIEVIYGDPDASHSRWYTQACPANLIHGDWSAHGGLTGFGWSLNDDVAAPFKVRINLHPV